MDTVYVWMLSVLLFIVGAMLGSFACCQVCRIHNCDKSKRSHCLNCKYQLKWYDNIPIISWLALGGKCRKCHKKIGVAEFLAEIVTAVIFVSSFLWWPEHVALMAGDGFEITKFVLYLVAVVIFVILFIYDAKWKELPTALMLALIGVAVVFLGCNIWQTLQDERVVNWLSIGGSLMILPFLYYLMYKLSKESWVGGGDWILCISLALMLGNFWLGIFCLFLSNFLGCVVMIPLMAKKKKKRNYKIPFGPFLIMGFLVVFFLQKFILLFINGGLM